MKKYFLIVILVLGGVSLAHSQKVITKNVATNGQKVEMKFDFADTIYMEAWNGDSIELEVTVNIDDNRYNDYYSLEINTAGNQTKLIEHVDFDGIKNLKGVESLYNFDVDINYKLMIPSDIKFSLETISGKIEVVGATGEMSVNTVSGFIDYSIPSRHKAIIDLSTVTGNVYSNVNFDASRQNEASLVGTKRHLSLNGGSLPVELKTVSGDIFLRRSE